MSNDLLKPNFLLPSPNLLSVFPISVNTTLYWCSSNATTPNCSLSILIFNASGGAIGYTTKSHTKSSTSQYCHCYQTSLSHHRSPSSYAALLSTAHKAANPLHKNLRQFRIKSYEALSTCLLNFTFLNTSLTCKL